jgi:hypothetical protein
MAHPCANQWKMNPWPVANRLQKLQAALDQEDDNQSAAGFDVGGWAYWLQPHDFEKLRTAYLSLCRALDAPTVLPGDSSPPPDPPPAMQPISLAMSDKIGLWAERVSLILDADEFDEDSTGLPVHPGQGMHGWLGTGVISPTGIAQAESLLTSMRNALDR